MSQVNGQDDYVLKAVISPLNALVMCSITTVPHVPTVGRDCFVTALLALSIFNGD